MSDKNILIADDLDDVREVVKMIVSPLYPNCFEASSGDNVIKVLTQNKIDLIILDFAMPHGNGLDVLTRICNELDYIPKIIILSSYCTIMPDDPVLDKVSAIVEKPYPAKKLINIMKELLGE